MPVSISSTVDNANRWPKLWWVAAKIGVTAGIFAIILHNLDFGKAIARALAVGPAVFGVAVLIAFLQVALVGLRWREIVRVLRAQDEPLPSIVVMQAITFGAQIVGQVLPFVAGDALRVALLRRCGSFIGTAVKSTVLDRGIGAIMLALFVPVALPLSSQARHSFAPVGEAVFALGLSGVAVVALLRGWGKGDLIGHTLFNRGRIGHQIVRIVDDLRRVVMIAPENLRIVSAAAVVHLLSLAIFAILAIALSLGDRIAGVVALAPLILLAALMPFAFGGWGVREGFAIVALRQIGVEPSAALALSLTFGATQFVAALPGVVALLLVPNAGESPTQDRESA